MEEKCGAAAYGVGALSGVMNTSICASTQTLTAAQVNLITAGIEAVLNGVTQGAVVGISGGNMVQGMASGAMASGVSSAVQMGGTAVGINGSKTVGTLFFGTVSGGFGSVLTGGNFWQGAASGLVVSGLNHVAHVLVEPRYFKLKYTTTNNNTEDGTTDILKPELELKIKGRINDGDITSFSLKITDNDGLFLEKDFAKGTAGDYYKELLNDSKVKIDGGYKYNIDLNGTIDSKIDLPGKIGKYLPKSVDFKFNFSFSYSYSMPAILTNHKFKYSMGKYGFWTSWMGVTSREYAELY